ncbi:hypothetical protein DFJ77DRAFT_477857 [Powellomyces hirtus]|nr:hypothetical protein DFJ77DRAFT_477857 [Powellomyces hirtus]
MKQGTMLEGSVSSWAATSSFILSIATIVQCGTCQESLELLRWTAAVAHSVPSKSQRTPYLGEEVPSSNNPNSYLCDLCKNGQGFDQRINESPS